jgi:hypothetical protein
MTLPRVFGLPHLSEDAVAAFADGVLAPAAALRAERHCAECRECAEAIRGQREAATMLRAAAAPALPSGLLDRLSGLSMSAPLPPPMSGLPTMIGEDGIPVFVAHNPAPPRPHTEAQSQPQQPSTENRRSATSPTRRASLPMGLLASAAAVVAAGTLGAHVGSGTGADTATGPAANNIGSVATAAVDGTARRSSRPESPSALAARALLSSSPGPIQHSGYPGFRLASGRSTPAP